MTHLWDGRPTNHANPFNQGGADKRFDYLFKDLNNLWSVHR